jgi:translocation and assembly module TamA
VVRKVTIAGANLFAQSEIIERLAHRPPGGVFKDKVTHLDMPAIRLDERRIAAFYRENGYFRARVTQTEILPLPDGVHVRFIIEEGQLTRIASIGIDGLPEILRNAAKQLSDTLDLQVGKPLLHGDYLDFKEKLRKLLDRAGYAHAEVEGEISVNRDVGSADIKIDVDPGPRVRFGDTKLESLTRIPEASIRARIAYEKGDRYRPDDLEQTRKQLTELGFASVLVDLQREGRPEVADVTIRVKDGKQHEVKLGAGLGIQGEKWRVRPRADYTHRGFLQPLLTLRARGELGYQFLPYAELIWLTETSLTRQDFILPLLEGKVIGGVNRDDYEAFTSIDSGGGVSIARPFLARHLRLLAGWGLHYVDIQPRDGLLVPTTDGSPPQPANLVGAQLLGAFQQAITLDMRDNPLSTRKGAFAEVKVEEGGPFAGGEVFYQRAQFDIRGYLPLGKRLVLAAHGMLGLLSSGKGTPLIRRFYGGGSSDHRGFTYRRLSPYLITIDDQGNISRYSIGGEAEFLGTIEVRWDLIPLGDFLSLGLIAFLDAGDVTEHTTELNFGKLHYAPGGGFRLNTTVGLTVRAEAAYRLNRTSVQEPDGRLNPDPARTVWERTTFHFSLGQSF